MISAWEATPEMVTMTLEEVRKRKLLLKREQEQLKELAAIPHEQIDTSDIPEIADFSGGVRGRLPSRHAVGYDTPERA